MLSPSTLFPSFHVDKSGDLSTQDPELLAALKSERLPGWQKAGGLGGPRQKGTWDNQEADSLGNGGLQDAPSTKTSWVK